MNINRYSILAILAGGLLALMINLNSQLASATSPLNASWFAHGIGGLLALTLYYIWYANQRRFIANAASPRIHSPATTKPSAPKLYFYLGGLPGALTVILASITVNSSVGLAGTLALGLIGQIASAIIFESFGLFGLSLRRSSLSELLPIALVIGGSFLVISQGYSL